MLLSRLESIIRLAFVDFPMLGYAVKCDGLMLSGISIDSGDLCCQMATLIMKQSQLSHRHLAEVRRISNASSIPKPQMKREPSDILQHQDEKVLLEEELRVEREDGNHNEDDDEEEVLIFPRRRTKAATKRRRKEISSSSGKRISTKCRNQLKKKRISEEDSSTGEENYLEEISLMNLKERSRNRFSDGVRVGGRSEVIVWRKPESGTSMSSSSLSSCSSVLASHSDGSTRCSKKDSQFIYYNKIIQFMLKAAQEGAPEVPSM
ncbi:hypothetical protein RJ641_002397 [Dillenia turbinata]|uniref:Uncharacterized protein n=1 Tax=Dillenia turbinata TaxID=194707 RepID=A0AAN8VRV5_9MAGN